MTLLQCYEAIGGNYKSVTSRFGGERLTLKFAFKFIDDPSYKELEDALASGDTEGAFRAAHTLKGVCQNLSFDKLGNSASAVTEALRAGNIVEAKALFPELGRNYRETIGTIQELRGAEL